MVRVLPTEVVGPTMSSKAPELDAIEVISFADERAGRVYRWPPLGNGVGGAGSRNDDGGEDGYGGGGGGIRGFSRGFRDPRCPRLTLPPRLFAASSEPLLHVSEYFFDGEPTPPPSPPPPPQRPPDADANTPKRQNRASRSSPKGETEAERKRMSLVVGICATSIFLTAFLLVAITLRMTPQIDEMIRKENEEMLRMLTQSNVNVQPEHRPDNGSTGTSTSTPRPTNNEG